MKYFYSFILLFTSLALFAQEAEKKEETKLTWKGFVKNEMYFDSREVAAVRDGQFYLYPADEKLDIDGNDINAQSSFNMIAIQSRLTLGITGPDAFGAKTSGTIEGAFFGTSNADINGFRLRHAVAKLDWEKSQFMFGQTWHPMFITECFPGTVAFNTGVPFTPFARNPQLRFTYKVADISLFATAMSQRDFQSSGGTAPLRNAGIPEFQAGIKYKKENLVAGIGAGFKTLQPTLTSNVSIDHDNDTTTANISGDRINTNTVSSYSATAYLKFKTDPVTIKLQGTHGTNMHDVVMIGGYAVSGLDEDGLPIYTNYTTTSAWIDIHTNGKKIQGGLFAGITSNGGTEEEIDGAKYARGSNIEGVMRVAPRIMYNYGKVRFAFEPDVTIATYNDTFNTADYIDSESRSVTNTRLLFAFYYFFKK